MKTNVDQLLVADESGKLTRRQVVSALALTGTAAALGLTGRSVSAQQLGAGLLRPRNINHASLVVTDLERSAAAYQQLFGLGALRPLAHGTKAGGQGYGLHFNVSLGQYPFLSLTEGPKAMIDHVCIGVDDFHPKRDGDRLSAAGFDVRPGSDETIFVRSPDGHDLEISDTRHTGICDSCPPPPAEAIGPPKGKPPALRARTINHFDISHSSSARAEAYYTKLFAMSRETQRPSIAVYLWGDHMGWVYYITWGHLPDAEEDMGVTGHICIGVDGHRKEIDQDPREIEKIQAAGWPVRPQMAGCNGCLFTTDPDGLSIQIQDTAWNDVCLGCAGLYPWP